MVEKIYIGKKDILRPKQMNEKKGFVNVDNKWVIKPIFEDVDVFRENVCWVKSNHKWGLINSDGKFLIDPQFEDAREFNNGCAHIKLNGKWGVIDKNGKIIIPPLFDIIRTPQNGFVTVVRNNKSGFANLSSSSLIQSIYDDVHDFSEGLAAVKVNGLWGFINQEGEMVIEPQFTNVVFDFGEWREGEATVEKLGNYEDEYGDTPIMSANINKEGKSLGEWTEVDWSDNDKWSYEDDPWMRSGVRTSIGYIDSEGNWLIKPKFQFAESFVDNIAIVRIDNKYGVIEKSGAYIVAPEYSDILRYKDSSYIVFKKKDEEIYTDYKLNIIDKPSNDEELSWIDSILKSPDNERKEAIVSQKQNSKATFPSTASWNSYKIISNGCKSAVIDEDCNIILKDNYETYGHIISISEGIVRTQQGDYFGFVSCDKKEYIEPIFNYAWDFSEGVAVVRIVEGQDCTLSNG